LHNSLIYNNPIIQQSNNPWDGSDFETISSSAAL